MAELQGFVELQVMMQLRLGLATRGPAAMIAQQWPDALALEQKLQAAGFDSVEMRNAAIKNWLRMTSWQTAQHVFGRLSRAGLQPTKVTLHTLANGHGTCDSWHRALHYFELARQHDLEVSGRTLRAVAYSADAAKAWPVILQVLQSFRKFRFQPDASLWNLAMRKSPRIALDLLREIPQAATKSYSAALGTLTKALAWQKCCDLMSEMSSKRIHGLLVDSGIGVSEQSWRMAIVLQHCRNFGWEPSAAVAAGLQMKSYNGTSSRARSWEDQIGSLEKLRTRGYSSGRPDPFVVLASVLRCKELGRWELCLQLQLLQEAALQDDGDISVRELRRNGFNAALASAGDAWCWLVALKLLRSELKASGADIVTCSAAASAATSARQWREAVDVLGDACRYGLQLDVVAYSAQMAALEHGARWRDAMLTLQSIHLQLRADAVLLRGALSAFGSRWQWQSALEQTFRWPLKDTVALEIAARACQAAGSWWMALHFACGDLGLGLAVIALEAAEKSLAPPALPVLLAAANPVASANRAKVASAMQLLESHGVLSFEVLQIFVRKKIHAPLQKLSDPTRINKFISTGIRDSLLENHISLGGAVEQRSLTSLGLSGTQQPIATWSARAQLHAEVLGSVREQGESDAQEELIASFLPCWAAAKLSGRGYRGRLQGLGRGGAPGVLLPVAAHHPRGRHAERHVLLQVLDMLAETEHVSADSEDRTPWDGKKFYVSSGRA